MKIPGRWAVGLSSQAMQVFMERQFAYKNQLSMEEKIETAKEIRKSQIRKAPWLKDSAIANLDGKDLVDAIEQCDKAEISWAVANKPSLVAETIEKVASKWGRARQ
jgi:hypothetical protein